MVYMFNMRKWMNYFLEKNKLMPVNIYKGSNNSQERYIGLDTNLFNNAGMWTKLAYFNQQDTNDKSDLENFILRLKKMIMTWMSHLIIL